MTKTFTIISIVTVFNFIPLKLISQVYVGDSLALVDLYNNTNGPGWAKKDNWFIKPVGSWFGIDTAAGRVTNINLENNNLVGQIPGSIGQLTHLYTLNLAFNTISGTIPSSITNMDNLDNLALADNQLSGNLPEFITSIKKLRILSLSGNQFTGSIPASIGNLKTLVSLGIGQNQLSGSIPSTIGLLSNLEFIDLGFNQLTGSIPASIGNLGKLNFLNLSSNLLSDTIPASIGNLTSLTLLDLGINQITGKIPASIGNLTNLEALLVAGNLLTSEIPSSIGNCTKLKTLRLSYLLGHDHLTGTIPASIGNLVNLETFEVASGQLGGAIPASMTNCTKLTEIDLKDNRFTFAGMEGMVKTFGSTVDYLIQAHIKIIQHSDTLSVNAGGTLSNNSYHWTADFIKPGTFTFFDTTIVGDSVFIPLHGGKYSVSVKNAICKDISLASDTVVVISRIDPNQQYWVEQDGSIDSTLRFKVDYLDNATIKYIDIEDTSAITDGITKIVLAVDAKAPVTYSIAKDEDGFLSNLADLENYSRKIIVSPNTAGRAVCIYTVPNGYGNHNPAGGRNIYVKAIIADTLIYYCRIRLQTPPVVLVHGMWSGPDAWQSGGFASLLNTDKFKLAFADYSSESASSFNPLSAASIPGRRAVAMATEGVLDALRKNKIGATQVDVVAHSLGGLMTRSWSQQKEFIQLGNFNKGYIHKLITLATPHRGSPLGPELVASQDNIIHIPFTNISTGITVRRALQLVGMPIGACHEDFAIESDALYNLGRTFAPPYLSHAVVCDYNDGLLESRAMHRLFKELAESCLDHPYDTIMYSRCADSGILVHDLIVPVTSQGGYISRRTFFKGVSHSMPAFTTETNYLPVQLAVADLLISDDISNFSSTFPPPGVFDLQCNTASQKLTKQKITLTKKQKILGDSTSFIQITSPAKGTVYGQNSSSVIKLQFSITGNINVVSSIFIIDGIGWYSATDSANNTATITLPKTAFAGSVNVVLAARGSDGIIYGDTTHIILSPAGALDSIAADMRFIKLDTVIRKIPLYVHGYYRNSQQQVTVNNITPAAAGTIYSSIKGTVFSVDENGVVSAKQAGTDTLVITNSNKSIKLPVTVSANFSSRVLYNNLVEFPIIPDKITSDEPFGISALASSGKSVSFTVVSGPAAIQDDIVTLTGEAGMVTIAANATADIYFSAATTVTRSFLVSRSTNVYTFTGNGKWSVAANWKGGIIPPAVLPSYSQVIIDPVAEGECILDIPQTIPVNNSLLVMEGKHLNILGNLTILK